MAPSTSLLQKIASTDLGLDLLGGLVTQARATLIGEQNLPRRGGALLVGNHALGGLDAFPLTALLIVHTGRVPRFLGERNLWRIPGLSLLLAAAGAIPGAPDAAVRLLAAGELVCVYPGGIDDSFKLTSEAYTLKWGARAGFAADEAAVERVRRATVAAMESVLGPYRSGLAVA